jgi:hypothetical protein
MDGIAPDQEGRMKKNSLKVFCRFVLVAIPMCLLGLVGYLAKAQDQPLTTITIPPNNLLQVAILRWYPANLTTTFGVGSGPTGVAFDGANIWVASANGTVSKL